MSNPWFRLYAEFATDPVVQSLSFDDQRHFIVVLCLKCSGLLDRAFGDVTARYGALRRAFGLDDVTFGQAVIRLSAAGLIDADTLQPTNWDKRQFKSDTSDPTAAERMRRLRERKKHRNNTVTLRPSESDTDTDTDKKIPLPPEGLSLEAWYVWQSYRKLKPASILAAQRKLAAFGDPDTQMAIVDQSVANGWKGLFEIKGSKKATEPVRTWTPSAADCEPEDPRYASN